MEGRRRIERRLTAAIVLTALIPLLGAVFLAEKAVRLSSERFFMPELGARLDEALGLYQELARAEKSGMRSEATAIAEQPELRAAVSSHDQAAIERVLGAAVAHQPKLVSLSVVDGDKRLGARDRGRPVDEAHEVSLTVRRPLSARAHAAGAGESDPKRTDTDTATEPSRAVEDDGDADGPELVAVFATDKTRYDGLDRMSEFKDAYGKLFAWRGDIEGQFLRRFSLLLGFTIAAAIVVGVLLARSVSTRIVRLAEATRRVGAGDLTTRVAESGADEVGDLARAFNRMLAEIETTRTRIEYLQRIGAWQEMARRLAHEIKNPLTPIQLAVEEIHQRYDGAEPQYRKLLDATLEVVQAEVGTLRRLVGEFSDFARLPQARLELGDLARFIAEQANHPLVVDESVLLGDGGEPGGDGAANRARVTVTFDVPDGPAPVYLDRQMLRRVLINLIRNSAQAIRDQGRETGRVKVSLSRVGDFFAVDVDDDGPGISAEDRQRIFDPYVTTKHDGTGLGLAIVKKIVVEHGGAISALPGPLGGARIRLTIPASDSPAAAAALEADPSSSKSAASPAAAPAVQSESA